MKVLKPVKASGLFLFKKMQDRITLPRIEVEGNAPFLRATLQDEP